MLKRLLRLTLVNSALAIPAGADVFPDLSLPVSCELGHTCFIQNHFDHDQSPSQHDFTCAGLSYDGHRGTDFALPSINALHSGVPVIAAASGTIAATRNTVPDLLRDPDDSGAFEGQACGNGVRLDHGDGIETLYCHLRQNSVMVEPGQWVAKGTPLGLIGASGNTTFPHLHFSLLKDKTHVDPFNLTNAACGSQMATAWVPPIPYRPGGLIAAGLAQSVPEYPNVQKGLPETPEVILHDAPLVLWVFGFGSRLGDDIRMTLTGPDGPVLDKTLIQERPRAQFYVAWGRRPGPTWPAGRYTADLSLIRDSKVLDHRSFEAIISR